MKQAEILDGVGMETPRALKGYVRFIPKPSAEMILRIDRKEPLLERWQYGLGRAAVFASDAKSRWAADWVTWNGYDKFWTNLSRDLLPHAQAGEADLDFDSANGDLVANYRLGRDVEEPATIPEIFVFGPDGFRKPIDGEKSRRRHVPRPSADRDRARACSAFARWRNRARFPKSACTVLKLSWTITARTKRCSNRSPNSPAGASSPIPRRCLRARPPLHRDHPAVVARTARRWRWC